MFALAERENDCKIARNRDRERVAIYLIPDA